ncbi:unnamed protein product, partial [Heterosigma akashiwo]
RGPRGVHQGRGLGHAAVVRAALLQGGVLQVRRAQRQAGVPRAGRRRPGPAGGALQAEHPGAHPGAGGGRPAHDAADDGHALPAAGAGA